MEAAPLSVTLMPEAALPPLPRDPAAEGAGRATALPPLTAVSMLMDGPGGRTGVTIPYG